MRIAYCVLRIAGGGGALQEEFGGQRIACVLHCGDHRKFEEAHCDILRICACTCRGAAT